MSDGASGSAAGWSKSFCSFFSYTLRVVAERNETIENSPLYTMSPNSKKPFCLFVCFLTKLKSQQVLHPEGG